MLVYILVALVVIIFIALWLLYNSIVSARNIVEEAFSGIDIQLKKRFDLIPGLIEAVKGYNAHEAELLSKIVEMRSAQTDSLSETAKLDQSITQALKQFRIQIEAYPDLKANVQFLKLMEQLSLVENELAMARRYYNGTTRDFNTKIQQFPAVIVAKQMGEESLPFYEIENEAERQTPEINLSDA